MVSQVSTMLFRGQGRTLLLSKSETKVVCMRKSKELFRAEFAMCWGLAGIRRSKCASV